MPLIALGWCGAGQRLPAPLYTVGTGPIVAIAADQSACPSASDRLRLVQAVFDAGIDCVALSPSQVWPLVSAQALAVDRAADLMDQICSIARAGQLLVAATWEDTSPIQPPGHTGRSWLRALHARQTELDAREHGARRALLCLVEGLPVPKTAFSDFPSGVAVTLLIRRDEVASVRSRIETAGRDITGPEGMKVIVTGLWPPLNFVRAPEPKVEVSA